jgi:16S rRNA processing protein RimM
VAGVFGLRGELKIDPSRIGADALAAGMDVRATLPDGTARVLHIRALRLHKGRPLASFDGIDDANAAQALVGATLAIDRAAVELARDEYFDEDLVGCTLVDEHGRELGAVVAVEHYPAQDMLRVGPRRAIVPLVHAFVRKINVAARRIEVTLPSGLLDDAEAEVDAPG